MPTAMQALKNFTDQETSKRSPAWRTSGANSLISTLPRGSGIAKEVLECIAALYQIEASIRGDPPDRRKGVRQELALPLR